MSKKSFFQEFKEFVKDYKVVGLAIAVIIGSALNDLVSALVNDLIMPVIGLVTGPGDWRDWSVQVLTAELSVGHLLGAFIDFLIIALIIFWFAKKVMKEDEIKKK